MKVDFHTHFIPQQFPDMGERYGGEGWPTLLQAGPCQADIYHAGKHYRRIDDRSWDPERRLKDMDAEGIDVQVLSPIPVTFAYRFSAQAVLELAQLQEATQRCFPTATRVDIDAALARLPMEYRAAVVLRDLCGLSYDEIGAALGVPPGTVRSRISRGRTLLPCRRGRGPRA